MSPAWTAVHSVLLASFSQMAAYICLPAVPLFAHLFPSGQGAVAVSMYLLFAAVGQLSWGGMNDRAGRLQTILWGISLGAVGTVLCAAANTWLVLLGGRAIQALGFSSCLINSRSILRDRFEGDDLTKITALCMGWIAVLPTLTPILGGMFANTWGWRGPFVFTFFVSLALFTFTYFGSRHDQVTPSAMFKTRDALLACLATRPVVWGGLLGALHFAAFSAFMANAPDLAQRLNLYEPVKFGIFLSVLTPFFILGAFLVNKWPGATRGRKILIPIIAQILCAGLSLGWVLNGQTLSAGNLGCITVYAVLQGAILPAILSRAMSGPPEYGGTASSLFGAMQMIGGAGGVWLAHKLLLYAPVIGMHVVIIGCLTLAGLLVRLMERGISS